MPSTQLAHYFLFFCLAASIVVVFFIFQPFLAPLVLAAIFAYIFQPLYQKFLRATRDRAAVSAMATTIVSVIIVLLPLTFLGTLILKESTQLYQTLSNGDTGGLISMVENAVESMRTLLPLPDTFSFNFSEYLQQGAEAVVQNLGNIFSSFAKIFMNVFVFLMAFYFFLKDGERLKNYLVELSPLSDENDEFIVTRLKASVAATIKGNLSIGLIQGILTGVGFAIFGVPNPALWGSVAAIMALVPGIGTALVIVPAVLFLFAVGETFNGTALILWGLTAVGLIDNFLGPELVGRSMQMHPLAVFLAVLGGLAFFGPMGFLLGPLAVSVCVALIDIYFSLKAKGAE